MHSTTRRYCAWFFLILAVVIWIPSGDVIDMIIRQKEIVFGRYSRGHFGALFFVSLLLLGMAALCFSKIKTVAEMLAVGIMVVFSTVVSGFVLVIGSGIINKPRYVETNVSVTQDGVTLEGISRHRPPNEIYQLHQEDKPEQHRSYPNPPAGYPAFDLTLTSDKYGFRNLSSLEHYPIVAVGDSFVAGSHVSDEQAWVSLLSKKMNTDIYNLGVSGADPGVYVNNFVMLGKQFKPKIVLFMIYEGNDFKDISPILLDAAKKQATDATGASAASSDADKKSFSEQINYWAKASSVTRGLQRLSSEVFETIGSDRPVPGYSEVVGWMPVKVPTVRGDQYYSFEPKRLIYLYERMDDFMTSGNWQAVKHIMESMVALGEQKGFQVVFIYAPSTPHVVMPIVREQIPAEQLRRFASYQKDNLPDAETFKQNVFQWMDNEENIFLEQCGSRQWHCLSLTSTLRQVAASGEQVYYTYDQHWTPEGNRVVADTLSTYLLSIQLSQLGTY